LSSSLEFPSNHLDLLPSSCSDMFTLQSNTMIPPLHWVESFQQGVDGLRAKSFDEALTSFVEEVSSTLFPSPLSGLLASLSTQLSSP